MRSIYSDACELSVGTRAFVSLLGVVEALFIVCLYVYVKRSEFLAKNGSRKASSILCLPVYNLVWQYVLYGVYHPVYLCSIPHCHYHSFPFFISLVSIDYSFEIAFHHTYTHLPLIPFHSLSLSFFPCFSLVSPLFVCLFVCLFACLFNAGSDLDCVNTQLSQL